MNLKINNYNSNILHDVSFEIAENENVIVLGSNGAGKTTLAKVLCGLIGNEINFGNQRTMMVNYIPAKLEIFDEYLSVKEFLELSCLYGKNPIQEVLEILEIQYLEQTSCKFLSSGESQLILLASAILHNAQYTILDEPTSNLDPQKVKMVYQLLQNEQLFQSKIIITHNLDLAYKLGYNIVFMQDGKIQFKGSSAEFFDVSNLKYFFDDAVKKIEDTIVVDL